MFGLTVRWSLADAPPDALDQLRTYVEDVSFRQFAGLDGLRFKVWRARDREWFEGVYVFVDSQTRSAFQHDFESRAHDVPGTRIIGRPPEVEPFEVVAAVRGPSGFRSATDFEHVRQGIIAP